MDLIHGARNSGGQRAWVSANPVGLSQRRSGRLESAAIWRAWVSGDPAGMSQRRSGGLESAVIRRAWVSGDPAGLSQRWSGGHESAAIRRARVRGGPVAWSPANGAPGGAAARELGNPPGGYLPRSAGIAASGLAALVAIPPNSHAILQWAMAGLREATSLPRDRHKQTDWNKTKDFWKRKTKRGEWAPLTVWVWSSVTVHTRGRNRNTKART